MAVVTRTCEDCHVKSPPTEEKYSLLHLAGWRSALTTGSDGRPGHVWRCPACWAQFKKKTMISTSVDLPKIDALRRS